MTVEKFYIARHGFRLNWVTMNWKSETGLPRDPPLAAYGVTQAKELAEHFLSMPEDERPTAIFSSPYYRCLQTAQPTSEALGLPIYVEHGLSEWYSPVVPNTGLHPRPDSATSLKQYFPSIDADAYSSIYFPSRLGETVAAVHDRTDEFMDAFIPHIETKFRGTGKETRPLLVTHAATVITLVRSLTRNRESPLRVGCCSLSEAKRKDRGSPSTGVAEWEVVRFAEGGFLKEGLQRQWGFEDIEISNGQVVEDPGEKETCNEDGEPVGLQIRKSSPSVGTTRTGSNL